MGLKQFLNEHKNILGGAFVLLLVILGITYTLDPDRFSSNFPNALVAWGTATLAVATFFLIWSSKKQEGQRRQDELDKERRDRDERLLNEIIEWANGILACCFTIEEPVITEDISSLEAESSKAIGERIRRASFTNMLQRYQAISVKFESMIGIASIFDENLGQNIRTVHQNLSNEIYILFQFIGDKSKA